MPIQFFCPACRQPIEIDEDGANQPVTCPYCRKMVTAPDRSDPTVKQTVTASAPDFSPDEFAPLPSQTAELRLGTNKLSWAALICALVCIVSWLSMIITAARMIGPVAQPLEPKEAQRILSESASKHPVMFVILIISVLGAFVVPFASLVLAILALLIRKHPRWPDVVSLCIASGLFILLCLNLFGQLAGMQGKG